MTESPTETTATPAKPLVVTWRKRDIEIKLPNGAQLMMWNRVATQFGRVAEADEIDLVQFRKTLTRLSDVVFGVIAKPEDVEWLEDEILMGNVADNDLLDLFTTIRNRLAEGPEGETKPNRAERRSTAKRVK